MDFGEFVANKRRESGKTIRELSEIIKISPAYFCNMEKGKRPAPSGEIQNVLADALRLSEKDKELFFELAAETKRDGTLAYDISEYVNGDENIKVFLRQASKFGICGQELLEYINGY